MLEKQSHQGIFRVVIFYIEAQITQGSGMDQFLWFTVEQVEKSPQLLLARRGLQIFNNVELDVSGTQDFQRTVGFASLRVMVDGDLVHNTILSV